MTNAGKSQHSQRTRGPLDLHRKCYKQSVKLSSVCRCFILGCTWSWLCQVQIALCTSVMAKPSVFSLSYTSIHVGCKVEQMLRSLSDKDSWLLFASR